MVSIRALILLLLLSISVLCEPYLVEISATTSHSPQVKEYYTSMMKDLRFYYYSRNPIYELDNESESLFGSNISTTTDLALNFGRRQLAIGKWRLTPVFNIAFSHKRLKFQQNSTDYFTTYSYYSYQRLTNLYAGFTPEFSKSFTPIFDGYLTPFIAIRPTGKVVQRFHYGQLDRISFTTIQGGAEFLVGMRRAAKDFRLARGLALSLHLYYERAVRGDRHLKTTYAYVLDRESHYPKHSWHTGMALIYMLRKFKEEPQR